MTTAAPPLVFLDTETTGVHPGRLPWEIAMIRRGAAGEQTLLIQITDVDLSAADPFGLRIGRFYDRHPLYGPPGRGTVPDEHAEATQFMEERRAARAVELWTRGAHIVGAVPNFDTETLDAMLRRHQLLPAWHYHLIDVEALAVGWLKHKIAEDRAEFPGEHFLDVPLPWRSEDLSRACGVEPASEQERHTALGDARWAVRLYDAITGGAEPGDAAPQPETQPEAAR